MSGARATFDEFLVALEGDGDEVLLVGGSPERTWIGLDPDLAPRWRLRRERALSLFGRHFVEEGVVRRIEAGGAITSLVRVAALDGAGGPARVLAAGEGGFLVARGQRLLRIDRDGRPLWPEVRTLPGEPTHACVSGDRVLVATDSIEYTHWGYLGPACLLRLDDGALVKELRGARVAALDGEGRFLLTLEGYSVFDTWLVDRDGTQLQTWRSSGRLVPERGGAVRVIEMDRQNPTSSRVVRLHRDGTIERGDELGDGQCSPPVELDDGRLVFVDRGIVRVADRALRVTDLAALADVDAAQAYRFHAHVARCGARVIVALSECLPEAQQPQHAGRTAADMRYRTYVHALDVAVTSPA